MLPRSNSFSPSCYKVLVLRGDEESLRQNQRETVPMSDNNYVVVALNAIAGPVVGSQQATALVVFRFAKIPAPPCHDPRKKEHPKLHPAMLYPRCLVRLGATRFDGLRPRPRRFNLARGSRRRPDERVDCLSQQAHDNAASDLPGCRADTAEGCLWERDQPFERPREESVGKPENGLP